MAVGRRGKPPKNPPRPPKPEVIDTNCSTCINGEDVGNFMIKCKFLEYTNPYGWRKCEAGSGKYKQK